MSIADRFWSYVDRASPTECWIWKRSRTKAGYGQFYPKKGPPILAHRFALALEMGDRWQQKFHALHRCDNPPCVNPAHLFAGTALDNARDMSSKGRQVFQRRPELAPRGERNGRAKLTDIQVEQVRALVAAGVSQGDTGRLYGISQVQVSRLVLRRQRSLSQ